MIVRLTGPELTALRLLVMERDGWRCKTCGIPIYDHLPDWHPHKAHLKHNVGRGAGGDDSEANCEASCADCHLHGSHNPKSVRSKS